MFESFYHRMCGLVAYLFGHGTLLESLLSRLAPLRSYWLDVREEYGLVEEMHYFQVRITRSDVITTAGTSTEEVS